MVIPKRAQCSSSAILLRSEIGNTMKDPAQTARPHAAELEVTAIFAFSCAKSHPASHFN